MNAQETWTVDPTVRFNRLHVIESLPEAGFSFKTGYRLFEELQSFSLGHPTDVQFHRLTSSRELWALLTDLVNEARDGHYPLLHFETHGAERHPGALGTSPGLVLASGELITWPKLAPYLIDINEATRLNLIVFMAACHGADVASLIQPLERAPARLLVGPMHTLSVPDLERSTIEFYRRLFRDRDATTNSHSISAALGPLEGTSVWTVTAEWLFLEILKNYYNEHTTDEKIAMRVEAQLAEMLLRGAKPEALPVLREAMRAKLYDRAGVFDQSYRKFFFVDKYPENAARFVLSFERCFSEAS